MTQLGAFQFPLGVHLRRNFVLGECKDWPAVVDDAPLRLLAVAAWLSEVPPPSIRTQVKQVTPQAQWQASKKWPEWVDQSEREARRSRSVAQDH